MVDAGGVRSRKASGGANRRRLHNEGDGMGGVGRSRRENKGLSARTSQSLRQSGVARQQIPADSSASVLSSRPAFVGSGRDRLTGCWPLAADRNGPAWPIDGQNRSSSVDRCGRAPAAVRCATPSDFHARNLASVDMGTAGDDEGGARNAPLDRAFRRPEQSDVNFMATAEAPEAIPPRPTTPCMNKGGDGSRRKRMGSAGRPGSRTARPPSGSIGARISELESALLARRKDDLPMSHEAPASPCFAEMRPGCCESRSGRESVLGQAPLPADAASPHAVHSNNAFAAGRTTPHVHVRPSSSSTGRARPSSSLGRSAAPGARYAPASLLEEAMAMCRNAQRNHAVSSTSTANVTSPEHSPRLPVARPNAPTPEQTNHWLRGMDSDEDNLPDHPAPETSGFPRKDQQSRSVSPDDNGNVQRPRSPTPTKMLAWAEIRTGRETACIGGEEEDEGRGDHTDATIAKLINACQMNDIQMVFAIYEKLCRMRVQLYEGVYKLIIECCMRTQQLGHAMQFYETLKGSGQVVSSRLVFVLIEACAKEQHPEKVHTIWKDWCPSGAPIGRSQAEVLLEAVSALIRTMSPDLARDVLRDAIQRSGESLSPHLADFDVQLEELELLNEATADEARVNGMLLGELPAQFDDLHILLSSLRSQCVLDNASQSASPHRRGDMLLMEDVDLDLELAAM